MDLNQDWKKAMKEAGFKYMDFVKSAKEGVTRKGGEGWAYRVVIVDLEIRLPNGFFSRIQVKVDMDLMAGQTNPERYLCDEVFKPTKAALEQAGFDEEAGSENNQSD